MNLILHLEYGISKENKFSTISSRALGEIGRICVKSKKFKEAINAFEEKLSLTVEDSIEKSWLFHDLGRCYLEIRQFEKALDYGQRSSSIADDLKDQRWGMNSRLLIAQVYCNFKFFKTIVRKKEYQASIETYEIALKSAKSLHDEVATRSITSALYDVNSMKKMYNASHKAVAK